MKKLGLFIVFLSLVSMGFASTMIDDFHGYANTTELRAVWVETGGYTEAFLYTTGGADSTTGSMRLADGGWGNGVLATDIIIPDSARGYKVEFKYLNGQDVLETAGPYFPFDALQLLVVQNNQIKAIANLGGALTTTWTAGATNAASLTTDPVSILIQNGVSLPGRRNTCGFDEIELVEDDGVLAVSVKPTDSWYLSRTEIIQAIPNLGVVPYAQIEFDVNADSSVEFTDTAEPWEFTWDTTSDIAIGTTGTVLLRVTVTDGATPTPNTAFIDQMYFIDNREAGRVSLIQNGDFSAWTGGNPDNWNVYLVGGGVVSQGASYDSSAAPSLQINYATNPDPSRYYYRSVSWDAKYEDIQVKMWGRHAYCRAYIFSSSDGGTSWANTFGGATAGNPFWVYVEGSPYNHGNSSDLLALCTHAYGTGNLFWDDIVVKGIDLSTTKVEDWNLY